MGDIMDNADRIAKDIYSDYQHHEKTGCGSLLIEWINEAFYGLLVKAAIPLFEDVWARLNEKKHISREKSFDYGDLDVSTWVERTSYQKILIYIRHCAMADDNTKIYILEDIDPDFPKCGEFRAISVWPRQVNYPKSWGMKGPKLPSLATYRKTKFAYGYQDSRDDSYIFTYKASNEHIDGAMFVGHKILYALDTLAEIKDALETET